MRTRILLAAILLGVSFSVFAEEGAKYVSVNEAVDKTGEQSWILKKLESERGKLEEIVRKKSEGLSKEAEKIKKEMNLLSEN